MLEYGLRRRKEGNYEQLDNLKEKENLEALDQILITSFLYYLK